MGAVQVGSARRPAARCSAGTSCRRRAATRCPTCGTCADAPLRHREPGLEPADLARRPRRRLVLVPAWRCSDWSIGATVGVAPGRADGPLQRRAARPAAVPGRVPDRAADRPRPARRQLGRAAAAVRLGVAEVAVGRRCSAPSSPSSRSRSARLRGLESTPATSLELMRSYAATWGQTLRRVRFPAAVPYMVPAFRLARRGIRRRRRRRRDLHGPARRDRPPRHRVRAPGDVRPGEGVHRRVRRRRPRAVDGLARSPCIDWLVDARSTAARSRSTRDAAVAVEVRSVTKTFNAGTPKQVDALVDIDLDRGVRGVRLADRAVRLRQVDVAAADRQPHRADGRARSWSTASRPVRPASTRTTGWRSSRPGCSTGGPSCATSSCRSS